MSVVLEDPAAMVLGLSDEMVGLLTVKVLDEETGPSLSTVTFTGPAAVSCAPVTVAVSLAELLKTVVSGVNPHMTVDAEI